MPEQHRRQVVRVFLSFVGIGLGFAGTAKADLAAVSLPYAGIFGATGNSDGPQPLLSTFNVPSGIAVDPAGTVYVADRLNNALRRIQPNLLSLAPLPPEIPLGTVSHVSIAGVALSLPVDVVFDALGNLWVSDQGNQVVRKFNGTGMSQLLVVGGFGSPGYADGPAATARFSYPSGLGASGGSVYVADSSNHRIRRIDILTGNVTTVAGSGPTFSSNCGTFCGADNGGFADGAATTVAQFDCPGDVAADASGSDLLVADFCNHSIRKVSGGTVSTIAGAPPPTPMPGFADGSGSAARFDFPGFIVLDDSAPTQLLSAVGLDEQEFYVSDFLNQKIRRVSSAGDVRTLATIDLEVPSAPPPLTPSGIAVLPRGTLLVGRVLQQRISEVVAVEPPQP
jgi:DNA-binding beta-propeller fold protein YncE